MGKAEIQFFMTNFTSQLWNVHSTMDPKCKYIHCTYYILFSWPEITPFVCAYNFKLRVTIVIDKKFPIAFFT